MYACKVFELLTATTTHYKQGLKNQNEFRQSNQTRMCDSALKLNVPINSVRAIQWPISLLNANENMLQHIGKCCQMFSKK